MTNAALKLESTLTKNQTKKESRIIGNERLDVTIRYDDECGNGHNSFAITGMLYEKASNGRWIESSGGCIHEEIVKFFPKYAPFIKWHLFDSTGPMHYVANTVYHASNRDHNGLLDGEKRQIKDRNTGLPAWELVAIDTRTGEEVPTYKMDKHIDSVEKPECPYIIEYRPWCIEGKGKERDFAAARSCAVWPEATEDQLSLPANELKALLLARLTALVAEFKADMKKLGFVY